MHFLYVVPFTFRHFTLSLSKAAFLRPSKSIVQLRRFPFLNVMYSLPAGNFCSGELLARAARWICTTVETRLYLETLLFTYFRKQNDQYFEDIFHSQTNRISSD
jgi:hypothetical protein